MAEAVKPIISIYTEQTPNPETIKFVVNRMLFFRNSVDFPDRESVGEQSALAVHLFEDERVRSLFISNNFVTIGKQLDLEWIELIPELKERVKSFISAGEKAVNEDEITARKKADAPVVEFTGDEGEIVEKIKQVLAKYVQPAVEMDGGSIVFRAYEDGVVKLGMQGACSGCPSSAVTLKQGIETMMKRMIPEVVEVTAESM
ncbi:NifU family protein [Chitinophagales bacterium]|nr:NifU family protein [Chitinophagales bacterium]